MYLDRLRLERFRSFENGLITFHPHLTAIVGENNGGKSNIVDALRLLFLPTNGRREIYCEESDIRRETKDKEAKDKEAKDKYFKIKACITDLSPAQKGLLISAVPNPLKSEAHYGLIFSKDDGKRYKPKYWAGKFEAQPEAGSADLIRYVYLPPLRDAQRALASGNPTRVVQLLRYFVGKDEEEKFKSDLQRAQTSDILTAIDGEIGLLLRDLTTGAREQKAALGFSDNESLYDIARDLRFKLADVDISPEELRHSGLGYANLLFMATVIMELEKAKDADLTFFLVEEPEAHLHPQLQMLVLDFLQEKAKQSSQAVRKPGEAEGRIQVIVTTHSPNLTAWIEPENLVVMRSSPGTDMRPASSAIAIRALDIEKRKLAKISRYLDVTRSAMLFGGRVMLIEGMAETLLLPVFAERIFKHRGDPLHADRQKWKRFQSASLVSIEGVDFEPYALLLLTPGQEAPCIAEKLVVVTDRDPDAPGDREEALKTLAASMGVGDKLSVAVNEVTLEQSLFTAANAPLLKAAFLDLHPKSEKKWAGQIEGVPEAERPNAFLGLFTSRTNAVRKGDYAQSLAFALSPKDPEYVPNFILKLHDGNVEAAKKAYGDHIEAFEIPAYLQQAISELVA
ncbi:AAA family ATPase [Ensifer sp. IC4062]|nr:AAA family ATPase [Ensifer sp. IC4062]